MLNLIQHLILHNKIPSQARNDNKQAAANCKLLAVN